MGYAPDGICYLHGSGTNHASLGLCLNPPSVPLMRAGGEPVLPYLSSRIRLEAGGTGWKNPADQEVSLFDPILGVRLMEMHLSKGKLWTD